MDILKIAGIGILGTFLALMLKQYRPELAVLTGAVTGLLIFFIAASKIGGVLDFLKTNALGTGLDAGLLQTMMKITGIAYISEFASDLCRDAGESSMASKIEMGGRILILVM
ncbi:MAG TPA: stage III sporulation protein AD, partial [Clostridiales bacterium]|nr:stage III sporulation protein AD [Clostridiales bacterium]